MTADKFRRLALDLPDTVEGSHMGHADFRVGGKIFASLGPNEDWGMVKLTPKDQARLIGAEPGVYRPASGAWGRAGATIVTLRPARITGVRAALAAAWHNTAPKALREAFCSESPGAVQGAVRTSSSAGARKRKGSSNSSPRKRDPR